MDGFATRLSILFAKLQQFQPANQRPCAYAGRACCLLDVSLRQESGNRVFLFTPEFFAMSCHQVPSDAICAWVDQLLMPTPLAPLLKPENNSTA